MEQLGKQHKNPNYLGMSRVSINEFHSGLFWDKHRKVWHENFDCNIRSSISMKQHSRDCITFWRKGGQKSSLKHMDVNIQKFFIMFWMEEFQEMVHFIITNWFNWSGVWIWNWFRVKFNWELWRVNLNITIINGIIIKSTQDSWNNRTGFGGRGPGFEVICWRLAVPIYWWFIWFFTIKGVELICLSSKNWWEELRDTDDACISLVSNISTWSANTILSHVESCNNCLDRCCIIVDGIWRNKMMIAMTWSGQCSWLSNSF